MATRTSKQASRTLLFRLPHFTPSSVLHSLAIFRKLGRLAEKISNRPDNLNLSAAQTGRGIIGFHLYREPHSLKPKRFGVVILSDTPLSSALYDEDFSIQRIPLPSIPENPSKAKLTNPDRVQYAGVKDIAPLIGLRLSESGKLIYNRREETQEDEEDLQEDVGSTSTVLPWIEVHLNRRDQPPREPTLQRTYKIDEARRAFKQFKGFRHLVKSKAEDKESPSKL